jgi:hypothetical protein
MLCELDPGGGCVHWRDKKLAGSSERRLGRGSDGSPPPPRSTISWRSQQARRFGEISGRVLEVLLCQLNRGCLALLRGAPLHGRRARLPAVMLGSVSGQRGREDVKEPAPLTVRSKVTKNYEGKSG